MSKLGEDGEGPEMAELSKLDEEIETLKWSKVSKASTKKAAMEQLQLRWNYSFRRKLIHTYYPKDIATAMGKSLRDVITTITATPSNGTRPPSAEHQEQGLRITLVHHHAVDIPMMVDVLTTTTAALASTLGAPKKHEKYRYTSLEQLSLAIRPYRGSPVSMFFFQGVVDLAIVCKWTIIVWLFLANDYFWQMTIFDKCYVPLGSSCCWQSQKCPIRCPCCKAPSMPSWRGWQHSRQTRPHHRIVSQVGQGPSVQW